jgi:hypothetical protein
MTILQTQTIVSGSSITDDSAWPTWFSWAQQIYDLGNVQNLSVKGLGNESIIIRAVNQAVQTDNPFIVVQLTSFDKWDWYVEDSELLSELQNEKHTTNCINNDDYGYWSTGSHFPKWKEYFKENYYSLRHQALYNTILIQWFQQLCFKNNWKHLIMLDSPIFSVTEEQLNTGLLSNEEISQSTLVNNPLCSMIFSQLDTSNIYLPGLIGYAQLNSHPWYTSKFKGHPGSYVHFKFLEDVLSKQFDKTFEKKQQFANYTKEAIKYQGLVNE